MDTEDRSSFVDFLISIIKAVVSKHQVVTLIFQLASLAMAGFKKYKRKSMVIKLGAGDILNRKREYSGDYYVKKRRKAACSWN